MSIIDLLFSDNIKKINHKLNICEDKIIKTRNQLLRSTSSCRLWQFKLCVLNYYLKRYNDEIFNNSLIDEIFNKNIIDEMCKIIQNFISSTINQNTYSILHKIIINNMPINIDDIESINYLPNNGMNTQMYYMCIYNPEVEIGSILHFFTIIRYNKYYFLNSSYGSDYVCVPQTTEELDISEFNEFCNDLISKNDRLVRFVTKYFLKGNLRRRYNNNTIEEIDPSLKSKWISPEEGIEKETSVIMSPYSNLSVGLIQDYENMVEEYIIKNTSKTAGLKRKGSRNKTQNKFKSKNRLSSSKNSKKKRKKTKSK
jgi:hypothetical protein